MSKTLSYAGIGSRETPASVLKQMRQIAVLLAEQGVVLRSGHAGGADLAFEQGCNAVHGPSEIYLPWAGFNGECRNQIIAQELPTYDTALNIAAQMHPNWQACSRGAKSLHTRNVYQVLGANLDDPVLMVICWTKNAASGGGTGQAIRIAKHFQIPVFDLADPTALDSLITFGNSLSL